MRSRTALTPPYINAIVQCTSSADSLITTFLNMSVKEILQCPTLVYVRVVYATVILIKLSISASMPSSELGKIIDPANNKIDIYLEEILTHLKAVATLEDGHKHVVSSKFLGILTKLKLWCQHQKQPRSEEACFSRGPKREHDKNANISALTQDDVPSKNAPSLGYGPPFGAFYPGPLLQYDLPNSLYEPPPTGAEAYFTDLGKGSTIAGINQRGTQPMQAMSWPASDPSGMGYLEPSSLPFNYPMDTDPSLFTHLINAELDQEQQDSWVPDADNFPAIDYSVLPEFNWATWPRQ